MAWNVLTLVCIAPLLLLAGCADARTKATKDLRTEVVAAYKKWDTTWPEVGPDVSDDVKKYKQHEIIDDDLNQTFTRLLETYKSADPAMLEKVRMLCKYFGASATRWGTIADKRLINDDSEEKKQLLGELKWLGKQSDALLEEVAGHPL